jgi:hypothetical protein
VVVVGVAVIVLFVIMLAVVAAAERARPRRAGHGPDPQDLTTGVHHPGLPVGHHGGGHHG